MGRRHLQFGFSLVELSIVLVILGLLTGGILAGQSLIRAAELRSVTTEYQRFLVASHTFRDKYFAQPGDFRDATRVWGRQVNAAHCVTNSSAAVTTPGACDGNGDGILGQPGAASQSGENFQYWRQLAYAGLVEGSYTGLAGAASSIHYEPGSNAPANRVNSSAVWTLIDHGNVDGALNGWYFTYNYGMRLSLGVPDIGSWPHGYVLKPEELWNIDTKMDDGKPGRGAIWAGGRNACTMATNTPTDYDAAYNLTQSAAACVPIFMNFLR